MEQSPVIAQIKKILSGIDDSLEDEDKLSMVRGYWDAGRLATEYKDSTGMLLKDIAREIEVPDWALQRYTQFYKAFSKGYPEKYGNRVVGWSLICCVLAVHDAKAREFYLKEACRHGWNKYELTKRIQKDYYGAVEDAAAANQSKTLKVKPQRLYTYAAEVLKILDADTFDLEIDVGFKSKQEHRVRLRGINAPEIGTPKGRKAKRFVERELARCVVKKPSAKGTRADRPLVVVKTYKLGQYGRYTVDIYYLPGETSPETIVENGKLLNQVLVDKGLARKVE
ncbi:MAG: thermonuclease family protein [Candidatus Omnitrophica bacterium]|nr:thermonuclease family protein [Candidatus Omnitrophota bacterium]